MTLHSTKQGIFPLFSDWSLRAHAAGPSFHSTSYAPRPANLGSHTSSSLPLSDHSHLLLLLSEHLRAPIVEIPQPVRHPCPTASSTELRPARGSKKPQLCFLQYILVLGTLLIGRLNSLQTGLLKYARNFPNVFNMACQGH